VNPEAGFDKRLLDMRKGVTVTDERCWPAEDLVSVQRLASPAWNAISK